MTTVVKSWSSLGAAVGALLPLFAGIAVAQPSRDEIYAIARDAWLYGYPIVTMDATMRQATNVPDAGTINMRAPINQFAHARAYPAADERDVVRYNFDTLYSLAWLDLGAEPVIVSVPDMGDRYYLLPMLDMWTDVFAVVGTRTTGQGAGDYGLVALGWEGELPDGVARIDAPTPLVWIIGRTQTDGPADYDAVRAVQAQYRLTPLSAWGGDYAAPAGEVDQAVDNVTPPLEQVHAMTGVQFLSRLAGIMETIPPHPNDQPILARLAKLGFTPGERFDAAALSPDAAATIDRAVADQLAAMPEAVLRNGEEMGTWRVNRRNIGTYGTSYMQRALVTMGGLGANLPEDAIYPFAFVDGEGAPLDGANAYVLHFPAEGLPPAAAFWSLTMYDDTGFQVPNPIDRFAVGSYSDFAFNADGSLDIYVQASSPGPDREANWLPAPEGSFQPTLRLYSPLPEALGGGWAPPPFEKVR